MESGNIKSSAMSGFVWKTLEQYGMIGIQFVLQIVLARLLEPEHYGVIAIANVFVSLSNVFIQNGFAVALVQKKELDDRDISSVFIVSEGIAVILYILMFFGAPVLAGIYGIPVLTDLVRVMSLVLFPGAYTSVQSAIIRREMRFQRSFFANISAVGISGVVGIVTALCGMGVWALALQQLLYGFLSMLFMQIILRWRPKPCFEVARVRPLLSMGWKVLLSSLIDQIFVEYRSLFIGKVYSSEKMSFYNRGKQFPNLLVHSINGAIQAVLLPVMSRAQDNKDNLKQIIRRSLVGSSYLVFPLLAGMAVVAPTLISVLLTEKWMPCVIFLQINCIFYATWPLSTSSIQALYSVGKSGTVLKIEVFRKVVDFAVLIVTLRMGIFAIAVGAAAVSVLVMPVYLVPGSRVTGYSVREQVKDVFPILVGTAIMSLSVYFLGFLRIPEWMLLVVQVAAGAVVYFIYSKIMRLEILRYLTASVFHLFRGKKER